MFDMIIKRGTLLDPAAGLDGVAGSVAVSGGVIAAVGDVPEDAPTLRTIDAGGCHITPGLVDFHAHVFPGGTEVGVSPDLIAPPAGVTTVVDGGSTGCVTFETFHRTIVANAAVEVRAMLNICCIGQPAHNYLEDLDPSLIDHDRIEGLCREYHGVIVAIKLRQSRAISKGWGLEPLKAALRVADRVGLPLVVHASDSPGDISETLALLRKGDVFCHVYHQIGQTILDDAGRVRPELFKARERGVLFDMARGRTQFSGAVAARALRQGFPPDIVSSDLTILTHGRPPAYSFNHIMGEMLALGMPLPDVVRACTATPSALLGRATQGFLKVGEPATITLFRVMPREMRYTDHNGNTYSGNTIIRPELTLRNGHTLFRQYDNFDA